MKKNSFLQPIESSSPDISFNSYSHSISFSITSEESTQLVTTIKQPENFYPRSVIFCLAIRKAFKSKTLRYSKFAFYLMRSLYKESISKSNRQSVKIENNSNSKKVALGRLQKILQVKRQENLKKKILSFCKGLAKVRIIIKKHKEIITKVFMIFYKNKSKNMKNLFSIFRAKNKAKILVSKLLKILFKKIFLKKDSNLETRVFEFLNKPKHNIPYIKFAQKTIDTEPKIKFQPVSRLSPKNPRKSRKPEPSKLHQKGIIKLCVLNRNYLLMKKRAFFKYFQVVKWLNSLEQKNRAEGFRIIIESLLRKSYIDIVFRLVSTRRDYEYFIFLTQVLSFVKHKRESDLLSHAFEEIYSHRKASFLDSSKIKYIQNFLQVINTKIFNKKFISFVLIKGFSKLRKSKPVKSKDFYQLAAVLKSFQKTRQGFAMVCLKSYYNQEIYLDNCCHLASLLKKIVNRVHFYKSLEIFDLIKQYSESRFQFIYSVSSKLFYMFKRKYTKITALSLLKWENEVQRFKRSYSRSYLNESNLSVNMNSYDTQISLPKLLPLPKNIHDYIDDILEVVDSDIPAAYFYNYS